MPGFGSIAARGLFLAGCFFASSSVLADSGLMARIQTSAGDILIELDEKRAPVSVANFREYADSGFYDGTIFHRVIEGFMIQGGGYNQKYMRKQTRRPIPNEATNGLSNTQYTISMARTNAPHSATSQFFINSADNTNLDHTARDARGWGYAVFGRVVDGHDVVDHINEVDTGAAGPFRRDVPRDQVIILSVQVLPANTDAAVKNAEIAGQVGNHLIGNQAGSSGSGEAPQTQQRQAKLN